MTKKDYLLKILEQLEPVRDLASGLKIVVEQGDVGDDILDTLISSVEAGIDSAGSEAAKLKMKKGLGALEKLKQIEQQSVLQDERELAQLDDLLNDF